MVVRAAKRTKRPAPKKKAAVAPAKTTKNTRTRRARTASKSGSARKKAKATKKAAKTRRRPRQVTKTVVITGRVSAPAVRLGMTPPEVRECSGQPECILFGADDHVEWQFGTTGADVVGAPTLYVTTLTFAAGRVVRITERMTDPS